MDPDIAAIWEECERELDANFKMGQHHQMLFEQTIGNLAALKMLDDSSIEDSVKNL